MPPPLPRFALCAVLAAFGACADPSPESQVGTLVLALDDDAAASDYVLAYARVSLSGPDTLELELTPEALREHTLREGVYTLTVADDYRLEKRAAPAKRSQPAWSARTPQACSWRPERTTQLSLRFELAAPEKPALGTGTVEVDVEVSDTEGPAACARYLRITELDYDQVGGDTLEFVEVALSHACRASLAGVRLELVNGGDGSVYARYELADAAATLGEDQVLVAGDAAVLSALPAGAARLTLNGSGLQNGPDGVRLVRGEDVLDSVAYEGAIAGVGRGQPALVDDAALSLTRCATVGDYAEDFRLQTPSPGLLAACTPAAAPP